MPSARRACLLALLMLAPGIYAQQALKGTVSDDETGKALPFVSVGIQHSSVGALTDLDGKFELSVPATQDSTTLICAYIGYLPMTIHLPGTLPQKPLQIRLRSRHLTFDEVVVTPHENPANRLIRLVLANRDANNPEKMHSFTYTSYNKMRLTTGAAERSDSLQMKDTAKLSDMEKFFQKQHLLFSESVSEHTFLYPDNNSEKVLGSRVSGFKRSPFAMLATQIQSFTFYNDLIDVLGTKYLNPISPGSTKRYYFNIEDTTYAPEKDTVFLISFRPFKDKNFNGLQGTLYINSHGYAIQNVIAGPVDNSNGITVNIQQQYKLLDGKQWFPAQLNTDWIYNTLSLAQDSKDNDPDKKLKVVCRTYISTIRLDPPVSRRQFTEVEVEMTDSASLHKEAFWQRYRTDSITDKEKRTYHSIDSIGREMNLDKKIIALEAILTARLPVKCIDIDLDRILRFNDYEGFRLGLGIHTNDKVSKWVRVGGYGAYGFKDKVFKYGGDVSFLLSKRHELRLNLLYGNDVIESANRLFFENKAGLLGFEQIRNLYVSKMDRIVSYEAGLSFRAFKYLRANVYASHQDRWGATPFAFNLNDLKVLRDTFHFNEAGIQLKYIYKEKFIQTSDHKFSMLPAFNTRPVFYANIAHGFNQAWLGQKGDIDYTRIDVKIEKNFQFRNIGRQTWQLQVGQVFGDVPYTLLYNNKGSFVQYAVSSTNSFETMGLNEFTSSKYAALFFAHNFGKFLPKNSTCNPDIELVHNMGYGALDHPYSNYYFPIKTMEKGYFESGLRIYDILTSKTSGIGVGVFYRYGPYQKQNTKDNIVLKITIGYRL